MVMNLTQAAPATSVRHLIGVADMERDTVLELFDGARRLSEGRGALPGPLAGRVVITAFYQPSTRTRLAFESAAVRLGGRAIGFADVATTRAGDYYQESLEDVVMNLGAIGDLLVLRHFRSGAARAAAAVSSVPVVNAGDGYNEHPSQALGDVWSMHQVLGGLEGASIGLLGDPSIRSLHSIGFVLARMAPREVVFLPAPGTEVPADSLQLLARHGVAVTYAESAAELLERCDLVETIGVRHPDHRRQRQDAAASDDLSTPARFVITADLLRAPSRAVPILHPGPRTDEITTDVDASPLAKYIPQVRHGMWMKGAMMAWCLGAL